MSDGPPTSTPKAPYTYTVSVATPRRAASSAVSIISSRAQGAAQRVALIDALRDKGFLSARYTDSNTLTLDAEDQRRLTELLRKA